MKNLPDHNKNTGHRYDYELDPELAIRILGGTSFSYAPADMRTRFASIIDRTDGSVLRSDRRNQWPGAQQDVEHQRRDYTSEPDYRSQLQHDQSGQSWRNRFRRLM